VAEDISKIKILYLNNGGGGFAERHSLKPGTTIIEFFNSQFHDDDDDDDEPDDSSKRSSDPSSYSIMVNRVPVMAKHVLKDQDIVTITPVKVGGGHNRIS